MKYTIGTIVVLQNGKQVYITNYNQDSQQYSGIDAENSDSPDTIVFTEDQVILTV